MSSTAVLCSLPGLASSSERCEKLAPSQEAYLQHVQQGSSPGVRA